MDRGVTSLARQAAAAARAEREAAERALLPMRPPPSRRLRGGNHAAPAASGGQVRAPAEHDAGYEPARSHPPAAARNSAARAAPNAAVPPSPAPGLDEADVGAALILQHFAAVTFVRYYAGFGPVDVPVSDLPMPTAFSSTDGTTVGGGASGSSLPAVVPGVPPAWLSTMPAVAGNHDQSVIADNFTDDSDGMQLADDEAARGGAGAEQ
ncbi:hypothetical protein ACP4OV_014147 [Aristida adscensionis]